MIYKSLKYIMKEIIIIETNKSQKLKEFLNKEHFSYKVYQETKNEKFRKQLIADYQDASRDEELNKELSDWDQVINDGIKKDE